MALAPDGSRFYAAHWESGTVVTTDPIGVYSTSDYSLLNELGVGRCVGGVAVSGDGRYIYGPAYYDGTLTRFDSWNSYSKTSISIGSWADKLWANADGTKLIVNYNSPNGNPSTSQTLALVDIAGGNLSTIKTLSMGRRVSRGPVAFSQSGDIMYIGCGSSTTTGPSLIRVSLSSFTISGSCELTAGANVSTSLAGVVHVGGTLYVADQSNSKLYTVDEATLTETGAIDLPNAQGTIGLHPSSNYLFVVYQSSGEVSVLDLPSLSPRTALSGLNPGMCDIKISPDGKKAYLASMDTSLGGIALISIQ